MRGDTWVELAGGGGGGGGLSSNEGRLGSDISATCIWAYPQYQQGKTGERRTGKDKRSSYTLERWEFSGLRPALFTHGLSRT